MAGKPVDLEVKPEGASGQVLAIPLSSTGSDNKAKTYEVRNEKGTSLFKVDATTSTTTLGTTTLGTTAMGTLTGALALTAYADSAARDIGVPAPAVGMVVYNVQVASLQIYDGASWLTVSAS